MNKSRSDESGRLCCLGLVLPVLMHVLGEPRQEGEGSRQKHTQCRGCPGRNRRIELGWGNRKAVDRHREHQRGHDSKNKGRDIPHTTPPLSASS